MLIKARLTIAFLLASMTLSSANAQEPVIKPPPPLPQATPSDGVERGELEATPTDPKRQKYLSLFIGIEHLEKLPFLPMGAQFKGDFKKVVSASINRDTSELLFQPSREGIATFSIHDGSGRMLYDFRIEVKKSNLTKVANEIRALLSDIEGISIKIANGKVIVDGQVLLPRDLSRIISVVSQYGDTQAASLVTLSPVAQRKIAQAILNDINDPEITVRAVNDKFILEGTADNQEESNRAYAIAQMYVPDIVKEAGEMSGQVVKIRKEFVVNLLTVKSKPPAEPGKIIQLVVHYVELNKNYTKSFRFQFTPTLSDQSAVSFSNTSDGRGPSGLISSITGTVSNLLPKLNWAKSHGHARVLQSSSLQVLDGQKGDLKNTVKIPYATINAQGQPSTEFEEAGLIASITPTIFNPRSDSIRLSMDFSMKALLGLTDRGPMVSNNSMQTILIVRSGQSAAVGGLISNSNGTDYNKLPKSVATDPIVSLYASKSFQRNQSQFVLFVTPIIKASASQGSEKVKEKFRLRD